MCLFIEPVTERKIKVLCYDDTAMMNVAVIVDPADNHSILNSLRKSLLVNGDFDGMDCVCAGWEEYDATKSVITQIKNLGLFLCCSPTPGGYVAFCFVVVIVWQKSEINVILFQNLLFYYNHKQTKKKKKL